ncbi:MAG TPA: MJ1477/TM1410 family putative glycoside hydrolase [Planctomycetota bacterium]|nr:MJ1477/TM1410 family putative glycoside hydrolase [Planctomycetota bacterium]
MRRALMVVALCLPAVGAGQRADLSWAGSWCIWLQAPSIDALAQSPYDVVVIDYSHDGSAAGEFSHDDIARLRAAGKTVLAYLSIGEAEDYRFYWKASWEPGSPAFIGEENPDWPGNYAVKYWTSGWWSKAIEPYLDRILAAGFDGVYLDRVDAYWWWYDVGGISYRTCANRMVTLVERIASYARERAGDGFVVCPQNGEGILDDAGAAYRARWLAAIDAVGAESVFFNIWSEEDRDYRLSKLAEYDAAGKKILSIECIDEADWGEYFGLIDATGLDMIGYPAAADMLLDELILY